MQPLRRVALAGLMAFVPALSLAHGCPGEMHKIDKELARNPPLDAVTIKKVRELRAEGEKLHKQEKHGESMLVLGSAKKLLKIDDK